jgi:hypothetical protein
MLVMKLIFPFSHRLHDVAFAAHPTGLALFAHFEAGVPGVEDGLMGRLDLGDFDKDLLLHFLGGDRDILREDRFHDRQLPKVAQLL